MDVFEWFERLTTHETLTLVCVPRAKALEPHTGLRSPLTPHQFKLVALESISRDVRCTSVSEAARVKRAGNLLVAESHRIIVTQDRLEDEPFWAASNFRSPPRFSRRGNRALLSFKNYDEVQRARDLIVRCLPFSTVEPDLVFWPCTLSQANGLSDHQNAKQSAEATFKQINWSNDLVSRVHPDKTSAVAVVDAGIDPGHPALKSAYLRRYDAFADFEYDPAHKALLSDEGLSNDSGTACASIIAGRGCDVWSIAPGLGILDVNCTDPTLIGAPDAKSLWTLANAIDWAAMQSETRVIQIGFQAIDACCVNETIIHAVDHGRGGNGTPIICPAGDGGTLAAYPARVYPETFAVAACDRSGKFVDSVQSLNWQSNYGTEIALCAPGVDIPAASPLAAGNPNNRTLLSGTAASAALISGTAALLCHLGNELSVDDVYDLLTENATPPKHRKAYDKLKYGGGLLNVGGSITALLETAP